jgi:hypothetical protein
MTYAQITPCISIILNLISAIFYACQGDIRHVIYWLAAAVLTASITF